MKTIIKGTKTIEEYKAAKATLEQEAMRRYERNPEHGEPVTAYYSIDDEIVVEFSDGTETRS